MLDTGYDDDDGDDGDGVGGGGCRIVGRLVRSLRSRISGCEYGLECVVKLRLVTHWKTGVIYW